MSTSTCQHIDGAALAQTLQKQLAEIFSSYTQPPTITIFHRHDIGAAASFLRIKQDVGAAIGVRVRICAFAADDDTDAACTNVRNAAAESDGVLVQLPLPAPFDVQTVLDAIPVTHDVDVLSTNAREAFAAGDDALIPPVVGAIAEIIRVCEITISGARVCIVGTGRLVGQPAAFWFRRSGATVDVCDIQTPDLAAHTRAADIVVLGVNQTHVLTPDMLAAGAMVFDAGASGAAGGIAPAADPACTDVAAFVTPVPGGIGPLTVACLYRNLAVLSGGLSTASKLHIMR